MFMAGRTSLVYPVCMNLRAAVTLFLSLAAFAALAQQSVLITGSDTTTQPDGGIIRRVQVDAQGRLVLSTSASDGGSSAVATRTTCNALKMATTQVNAAALTVPGDGGLTGRWYVRACNSARNAGTPIVTCTSDGQTPTATSTSSGDALEVSDCVTYYTATPIKCISDTATTQVTTEECN